MHYLSILKYVPKRLTTLIVVLILASLYIVAVRHIERNSSNTGDVTADVIALALIILAIMGAVRSYSSFFEKESQDLESMRQKRAAIEKEYEKINAGNIIDAPKNLYSAKPDILYTAQTSLNQLEEYYLINKSQARYTFTASIIAVSVGMVSVVFGVWQLYSNDLIIGVLPTIAGVLGQFIGAGYFYLHRMSINQFNMYFR